MAASGSTTLEQRTQYLVPFQLTQELRDKLVNLKETLEPLEIQIGAEFHPARFELIDDGNTTLETIISVFTSLHKIGNRKNKLYKQKKYSRKKKEAPLNKDQRITLEEYKVALMKACQTRIGQAAEVTFELSERLQVRLAKKNKNGKTERELLSILFPDLYIPEGQIQTSVDKLHDILQQLTQHIEDKNKPKKQRKTLAKYRQEIIHSYIYKHSGWIDKFNDEETEKHGWKKQLTRVGWGGLLFLQILFFGAAYFLEFMSSQSILAFIPSLSNPVAFAISVGLILVVSVADFAIGMQIFKNTYGFSLFGDFARSTHLQTAEAEVSVTSHFIQVLKTFSAFKNLMSSDLETYQQNTTLAGLFTQDINDKVGFHTSRYNKYRTHLLLTALKWGLIAINAAIMLTGSYFLGASLFAIPVIAAAVVSPWALIVPLMAISLLLLVFQQRKSLHDLIYPNVDRIGKLKEDGVQLVSDFTQHKKDFAHEIEMAEMSRPRPAPSNGHAREIETYTLPPRPTAGDILPGVLKKGGARTTLHGGSKQGADGDPSTKKRSQDDSTLLQIRPDQ